jgi:hypothetical protein
MAYTTPDCMLTRLATEELNTMALEPAALRSGWNSWHNAKVASRLVSVE